MVVAWVAACFSVPSRIRFSSSRGGGKLLQKLARGPPEEEGLLQPLALQPQTLLQGEAAQIYQSEL